MNPTIYTSCIKQFWTTTKAKTVNGKMHIQALVDRKKVIVTEISVIRALQLKDAEGTECLPNATIFEQLTLMGAKTTVWNEFSSTMASAIIYLATNQKFNFSKYIFDNMVKNLEGGIKFLMYPRFVQVFLDKQVEGMDKHKEIYVTPSHTKKVFANMKRGGKGFSRRVTPLFQTMMVQAPEELEPITDEAANEEHVPTHSNDLLLSGEDRLKLMELCTNLSQRGRKIADIDADEDVTLIDETYGRIDDNLMFDIGVLDEQEVEVEKVVKIKAAKPKVVTTAATTTTTDVTRPKARGVVVQEPSEFTTTTSPSQTSQLPQDKDKGNKKMVEPEKPLKKKDQILIDEEIAQRLQEELQVELEEEERLARQKEQNANIAK
ncbi:hypothetical protein Tco_0563962 [Tanacetum coccineum]